MFKPLPLIVSFLLFMPYQLIFASQNFDEIRVQAQLADDSYLDPKELVTALEKSGQVLIHQTMITESQVSYFLSEADGVQTISVRGTANLKNAMVDLDIELQQDPILKIKLPQGFAAAARAVYQDMKPYLKKDQPINLTGHSLGGAIAVVLGMYLQNDNFTVQQMITFGQPKVTNVTGAEKFSQLPLIRVVTKHDIVPLVPPISPSQIQDLDIYWHMGIEVILMGDGEYAETSGVKSVLRATKFTSSLPSKKNTNAHKMTTYITLIDAAKKAPKEIPYKMDITLWGISLN